jgi:hypothetical protein
LENGLQFSCLGEENLVGQRKGPTVFGEPYFDEISKSRHELLRIFGEKPRDCCGAQLFSTGYCSERRVWSAVGALKVEAVELIATELTGKVVMFGNAIDDEKKRDGEVHQRGLLWKSCDWGGDQEAGVKRKEWLCTTGEYRESFV